ncbi:ATP-binding protein [Kitasatospora kifunensis]|uniref:histidine kinase n=1 Tax=Kitasatospora kifunensis TaxID=58351 RepID=A0A7W7R720_KITKI|nr:ATP-binding protein [Kitasatospora kifunensis]MBB4926449.1 signal transduction histidine kinase [Kitasatospora kifunensis]
MRKRTARQIPAQRRRLIQVTDRRLPRRLLGTLITLPSLTSLTACGAAHGQGGSELWVTGGAAAVVLLGGTAVVVRRVTARPLEKARDLAARNLATLLDERGGLLEERARLTAERDAQAGQLQALAGERRMLLQEREELQRQQQELSRQWNDAVAANGESAGRLEELLRECELLLAERDGLAKERDELQGSVDATFVNLAMRTLTLVERQLVLIEALEGREADAAQLESLFRLDHLATRMRRNSENMLLLAGLENSSRSRKTVTLLDVVRAAVSEIERYERVKLGFLAAVRLSGAVADDTSHLLAELLENATAFSPPQEQVEVGGWQLDNGEVMISVSDRGIGLPAERLHALNGQLAEPLPSGAAERRDALLSGALTARSMGLFVVARLAARHGIRVQLRENGQGGGVTAMVVLPREALHQDGTDGTDLDAQRRAERSAAAHAEQARAAAEFAAAELTTAEPAAHQGGLAQLPTRQGSGVSGEGSTVADLPALPRRRPAHAAPTAAPEPTVAPEPAAAPEPTAASAALGTGPVPAPGSAAEDDRTADFDPPTQQLMVSQLRRTLGAEASAGATGASGATGATAAEAAESAAAPEAPKGGEVTSLGLPRRVPRGSGLPGTGETPTSGLRRLAAEPSGPEGGQGAAAAPPRRPRTSAEELRRRLGGFQSGLRQAARDSAAEEQDR